MKGHSLPGPYQKKGDPTKEQIAQMKKKGAKMKVDKEGTRTWVDENRSTHQGTSEEQRSLADSVARQTQEKADADAKRAASNPSDKNLSKKTISANYAKKAKEESERMQRGAKGSGKPGAYEL